MFTSAPQSSKHLAMASWPLSHAQCSIAKPCKQPSYCTFSLIHHSLFSLWLTYKISTMKWENSAVMLYHGHVNLSSSSPYYQHHHHLCKQWVLYHHCYTVTFHHWSAGGQRVFTQKYRPFLPSTVGSKFPDLSEKISNRRICLETDDLMSRHKKASIQL